jgi:hypothetical protein
LRETWPQQLLESGDFKQAMRILLAGNGKVCRGIKPLSPNVLRSR